MWWPKFTEQYLVYLGESEYLMCEVVDELPNSRSVATTLLPAIKRSSSCFRDCHDVLRKDAVVSADSKGGQFSRFGCEPESLAMAAGHTNTSAAVEDRQSRLRVFSRESWVSS
jgi:hypothetical protein